MKKTTTFISTITMVLGIVAVSICGLATAAEPQTYTIKIHADELVRMYPYQDNDTLPKAYYDKEPDYPKTLKEAITLFTKNSLERDGIDASISEVDISEDSREATIKISSSDPAAANYTDVMPGFISAGAIAWKEASKCYDTKGCWDSAPGYIPWAFYLPLGLPMVNQNAVMFLNYPPSDSLQELDYLDNFTMKRWSGVLEAVGIATDETVLYETIVDAHPIAAPGSGQGSAIAKTTSYFSGDSGYDNNMLGVLINTPTTSGNTYTLPVLVSGSPAHDVWADLIGKDKVCTGDVGRSTLPGQTKQTQWIVSNHPDVTAYQCCPGDTSGNCSSSFKDPSACKNPSYLSGQLVEDEIRDLLAACALKTLVENPSYSVEKANGICQSAWNPDGKLDGKGLSSADQQTLCVRARLDYNRGSVGQCKCEAAAQAFCAANSNNACPTPGSGTKDGAVSCATYNAKCPS